MPEPGPPGAESSTPPDVQTFVDRRRPGRVEYSNPHMIALLRNPAVVDPAAPDVPGVFDPDIDDDDNLAPAKGILAGLMMALPLWALIGAGAWLLLRG